jgi:hypothetical protein
MRRARTWPCSASSRVSAAMKASVEAPRRRRSSWRGRAAAHSQRDRRVGGRTARAQHAARRRGGHTPAVGRIRPARRGTSLLRADVGSRPGRSVRARRTRGRRPRRRSTALRSLAHRPGRSRSRPDAMRCSQTTAQPASRTRCDCTRRATARSTGPEPNSSSASIWAGKTGAQGHGNSFEPRWRPSSSSAQPAGLIVHELH